MNTTRLLTLAFTLLLVGATFGLWSQAASVAAAEAAPEQSEERSEDSEATDSEATSGAPSSEVFIPTEEISEDFAVSFPVDI